VLRREALAEAELDADQREPPAPAVEFPGPPRAVREAWEQQYPTLAA